MEVAAASAHAGECKSDGANVSMSEGELSSPSSSSHQVQAAQAAVVTPPAAAAAPSRSAVSASSSSASNPYVIQPPQPNEEKKEPRKKVRTGPTPKHIESLRAKLRAEVLLTKKQRSDLRKAGMDAEELSLLEKQHSVRANERVSKMQQFLTTQQTGQQSGWTPQDSAPMPVPQPQPAQPQPQQSAAAIAPPPEQGEERNRDAPNNNDAKKKRRRPGKKNKKGVPVVLSRSQMKKLYKEQMKKAGKSLLKPLPQLPPTPLLGRTFPRRAPHPAPLSLNDDPPEYGSADLMRPLQLAPSSSSSSFAALHPMAALPYFPPIGQPQPIGLAQLNMSRPPATSTVSQTEMDRIMKIVETTVEEQKMRERGSNGRGEESVNRGGRGEARGSEYWNEMKKVLGTCRPEWSFVDEWGVQQVFTLPYEHDEWERAHAEQLEGVTREVDMHFRLFKQRPIDYERKQIIFNRLEKACKQDLEKHACSLVMGGSSPSFLASRTSNLDLILVSSNPYNTSEIIKGLFFPDLQRRIASMGGTVLKVTDYWLEFTCSMGGEVYVVRVAVDCSAPYMSKLTLLYDVVDSRLSKLAQYVKQWATFKFKRAEDISRYLLTTLIVHFLQCAVSPPILPCLHRLYPRRMTPDSLSSIDTLSPFQPPLPCVRNMQSLGSLIVQFFMYYSVFDFERYIISIRYGTLKLKPTDSNLPEIAVEHPFDESVSHVVNAPISARLLRDAMSGGVDELLATF